MSKIEPLYQCERCKEDYPEGSCYPLSQLGHAGTKDGPILCDGCMDDYRIENDEGGDPSSWYAVKDPRDDRIANLERQLQEALQNAAFFRCCALSGEVPVAGAEPYPMTGWDDVPVQQENQNDHQAEPHPQRTDFRS